MAAVDSAPVPTPEELAQALAAFDPRSPGFAADPYPVFAVARRAGAPLWHEELGRWLAFRHADVSAVLRTKTLGRIYQDREPEEVWGTFNWLHSDSILDCEPPKHTRLRRLVSKAFTRGYIETLRPLVERTCRDLLDAAQAKARDGGQVDLIADYAEPLPVIIIAAMLGFPDSDQHLLRPWSQDIVRMYEYDYTEEHVEAARRSSEEFAAYVAELARARRADPTDDLVTQLVEVREEGDKLSERELIAMCILLLNAGHEASVNGLGNGLVAAFATGEVERLRSDPRAIADTAVEELLRYDSPSQLFERTATQDTRIGPVTIRTGERVAALLGSANRDPEVFEDPDRMDLTRDPNPHIAFGVGIHHCLGSPLARMEMQISVPMLFERFPRLQLAGTPVPRPTFVLRGYQSVPVTLG